MAEPDSSYSKGIERLFENGRIKVYPKNQLVHYQGDALTNIYLIQEGYIKAYTILDSGDTRTIMILSPGDIFPLAFSETMDWENYQIHYFYQTLNEVKVQVLPSEVLREHIETSKKMMETYMSYLAASNQAIMIQLEVMKEKKAIDKVGQLLPYLVKKAGKQLKPGIFELQLKLSHQELADLSGVTRETTTTLIKQLEKDGILDQSHSQWVINLKKLESSIGLSR
ncbi:MAG: Crp/Fnr family transcriptional regulator [Candidatus Saccharimonadales bacterium]